MRKIYVDESLCAACGICIEFCPKNVLSFSPHRGIGGVYPAQVENLEACTLCRICEYYCSAFAIAVEGGKDE